MKKVTLIFSLLTLLFAQSLWAALRIEVTQGVERAIPIAVVPFMVDNNQALPQDVAQIIYQDLASSGEFRVLDPRSIDIGRARDFNYWKERQVDYVVLGRLQPTGMQQYQVTYELLDVLQGGVGQALEGVNQTPSSATANPVILNGSQVATPAQLRAVGHYISDQVYEKLTGVRGIFSTRVAYVNVHWQANRTPSYRLEVADADGANAKPLLVSPEPIMSPSWAPDGRQIAYVSFEKQRAEIYISDLATGQRRLVSKYPGINGAPAWSPDGKKLAVVLSKENVPKIYVLDLATNQFEQITQGSAIDTEPRWAPDGRSIIFTSSRGGGAQIYRVHLADKRVDRLTYQGTYNARGTLTPDGKHLVMIHRSDKGFNIAAQDLANNQLYILTQTNMDESPSVAPNGRMIMYGTLDGGKRSLAAVSIDGRVKLRLPTSQGDVQEPSWSPFLR
ncbi:MAG: Tol-Pal system beta propeller repeat protein TolB [Gammaproteobacteria bacterium]